MAKTQDGYTPRVCVVGAGLSGLTSAKEFKQRGFDVTVFERSSKLGGVWNTAYRNVRLQQNKLDFKLDQYEWPEGTPDFPGKKDVQACLKGFASHFGLDDHIQFNTTVVDTTQDAQTGKWTVTTAEGPSNAEKVGTYDYMVVCCGALGPAKKTVADRLVKQGFKGPILHSSEYQAPTSAFSNRKVLVVGGSSSGVEVAVDLARTAAQVTMVIRDDVQWVFPRHSWMGSPMRLCGSGSLWQPLWLRNAAARALFAMRYGSTLDRFGLRPQHAPFEGKIIASDEFYTYLEHGLIKLERASSFEVGPDGKTIAFSSGSRSEADIIITCTGFEPPGPLSMPFMSKYLDGKVGLNHLYKSVFHPTIPNCAFVGYAYGFVSIPVVASLQARAAANVLSGDLVLPGPEDREADAKRTVDANGWGTTLWLTDNAAFREVVAIAEADGKRSSLCGSSESSWAEAAAKYALPLGVGLAAASAAAAAYARAKAA